MRAAQVLAVAVAALLVAPAASALRAPNDRVAQMVAEAKRLEQQALAVFKTNTADPQADELVQQSLDLLEEAKKIGKFSSRSILPIHGAAGSDTQFLRQHRAGNAEAALQQLEIALRLKDVLVERLEEDEWPPLPKIAKKATPPAPVPAPVCKSAHALAGTGCSGTSFWDINVDHAAKRARCAFTGPAGETDTMRPLFKGTTEITTCTLTKRYRVVDGVRKRIVHAELTITVPQGVAAKGSKPVRVTAYWQ